MDIALPPEGDVIGEHKATLTRRVLAVLFLGLSGAGLVVVGLQPDMLPATAVGVFEVALCVLAIAQQNKSRVVLRADGIERWGLRGKLWAMRWPDAAELHYRIVKVKLGGLIGALLPAISTNVHLGLVGPDGKKRGMPSNLKGMDVLAERVIEQQTTARLPDYRDRLHKGE